jgi:hypothetical protein
MGAGLGPDSSEIFLGIFFCLVNGKQVCETVQPGPRNDTRTADWELYGFSFWSTAWQQQQDL